ncbi:MAG: phosphate acetyltransferase [Candidatus Omnitrophica bacterium]|nr:phosphate acetyltransferase [Candidatus Omnitrophota bacterium]
MDFISELRVKAQKNPMTIVLPEGHDERTIAAAAAAQESGIAKIIILGEEKTIKEKAANRGVSLNGVKIIDHKESKDFEAYSNSFYELRKHKGMTPEEAKKTLLEMPVYFGALMVKNGAADAFVAGAVSTSADVARAAIYCIGIDRKAGTLSSSFVIQLENSPYGERGLFIFADCGVLTDPSPVQLAGIAYSSAKLFKALFDKEPKVALLSYSTKGSAEGPVIDKVRQALKIAMEKYPDLLIDGELQLDAAVDIEVAKKKCPGSNIAGRANVLIFPDLNSGNIGYKLAHRLAGARAIGPLLQGIARPCSDLSRGCSTQDIVDAIAITVVRCQEGKGQK